LKERHTSSTQINHAKPRSEVLDRDNPIKSKLKQNRKSNLNQPNIKDLKRKKKHLIKKKTQENRLEQT
jgi:hypothetical protein